MVITDTVIIVIYVFLNVLVVATAAIFVAQDMERHLVKSYTMISACFVGWISLAIAYRTILDEDLAVHFDNLPFIFIAFMPVALFVFALQFYNYNSIKKKHIFILSIIPLITSVIAALPSLNWLLRVDHIMLEMSPLHIAQNNWNIWFYVHLLYSYILMMASAVYIIWQHQKQASGYNLPSKLMVIGILITLISNIITVKLAITEIDFTLIGISFSLIIFYLAIANNPSTEFLSIARKALYDFIDIPIFILDKQEKIIDANSAGKRLMGEILLEKEIYTYNIDDIMEGIVSYGGILKYLDDDDDSINILLNLYGENIVYKMTKGIVMDKKGMPMGSYIFMTDITQLSQMIDDLEHRVDADPLTGISNRRAFEIKWEKLDKAENLPLSLIFGDIDQLKKVNDHMGHKHGDLLIKTVANILTGIDRQRVFPFRIGGDEFAVIIPKCDGKMAKEIAGEIEGELKQHEKEFVVASIALGTVTKTESEQELSDLMQEADRRMYADKQYNREFMPVLKN